MSKDYRKYCPICGRHINPENVEEFENGNDDGLLYIHDDISHEYEDLEAYEKGIN